METLVVGLGAVGAILSSRLSKSHHLRVLCRSNYLQTLKFGIEIRSNIYGDSNYKPLQVYGSSAEASADKRIFDHIFICTKSTSGVTEELRALVSSSTMIHIIQNGVGIEEVFINAFPLNPITSCTAFIRSEQGDTSNTIIHTGPKFFTFGPVTNFTNENNQKLSTLCADLQKNGIDTKVTPHIQWHRWSKLAWNASFSPISVLMNRGPKALLSIPETKGLVLDIMHEVYAVAERKYGPRPADIDSALTLLSKTEEILEKNGDHRPSMLVDWTMKRELEIDSILAAPIRIAAGVNAKMPKLQTILALLTFKIEERKGGSL